MKKIKNILFIFIALFIFVGVVNAEGTKIDSSISLDWEKTYELSTTDAELFTIKGTDNGFVAGGYYIYEETSNSTGDVSAIRGMLSPLLLKYDEEGKLVWKTELYGVEGVENGIIHSLTLVEDKIVALAQMYDEVDPYVALLEFSKDGEFIRQIVLCNEELDPYNQAHISYYDGVLVTSFNSYLYSFDKDLVLKKTIKEEIAFPVVEVNENGIYVLGNDYEDIHLVLKKYDYNLNEVKSATIVEIAPDAEDLIFASNMKVIGEKIVLSTVGDPSGTGSLMVLDKDFKVIKNLDLGNTIVYDIEQSRDKFVVIEYSDAVCESDDSIPTPSDINGIEEVFDRDIVVRQVQAACTTGEYFAEYDMDLNKTWEKELDFSGYQIDNVGNGIVLVGSSRGTDTFVGNIEKYLYNNFNINTKTDGNGDITTTKVIGESGEVVEFEVKPKEGYQVKKVIVTTASGEVIEFEDSKFTMPSDDVEVYVEFEKIVNNPNTGIINPFMICGIAFVSAVFVYCFLKKKKYV